MEPFCLIHVYNVIFDLHLLDTCSNGKKDPDEKTPDCGGSCGTANCGTYI